MPSIELTCNQPFSLDMTLGCGQVFRWDRSPDGWWYGITDGHPIKIRQDTHKITYYGATKRFIRHYFSLDIDLLSILGSINRDPVINTAIRSCSGLRLIRQSPWECLISYICSTNSNIPTIRRRIATIAEMFGDNLIFEEKSFYTFPDPATLLASGKDGITTCRLGYRASYVYGTSCAVPDSTRWSQEIRALPYEEARKELMSLPGVGPKAADCILLFAFQKYEAFPVDVWIRRIIHRKYLSIISPDKSLTKKEYDTIRCFARMHFGEYCGYAQEYLYAARNLF
jgi:N-glycosylase/DNA lyase